MSKQTCAILVVFCLALLIGIESRQFDKNSFLLDQYEEIEINSFSRDNRVKKERKFLDFKKYIEEKFDQLESKIEIINRNMHGLTEKISEMTLFCDANEVDLTILMEVQKLNKKIAIMELNPQEQVRKIGRETKGEMFQQNNNVENILGSLSNNSSEIETSEMRIALTSIQNMSFTEMPPTDENPEENNEPSCWNYTKTNSVPFKTANLSHITCTKEVSNSISIRNNCSDDIKKTGVYSFHWKGGEKQVVFCEVDTDGNWMVIQQRGFGKNVNSTPFNQSWENYKNGFGDICGDFWIGNELLHQLTSNHDYSLKIEFLDDKNTVKYHGFYNTFKVGSEQTNYTLMVGEFQGNGIKDGLRFHHGQPFMTYDHTTSQDYWICSILEQSGWWFSITSYNGVSQCNHHLLGTNLNAPYREFLHLNVTNVSICNERSFTFRYGDALYWRGIYIRNNSVQMVRMKIKPNM